MSMDVAEIAGRLTKAQREWLTSKAVRHRFITFGAYHWAAFAPARTLAKLANDSLVHPRTARILPLGLAVRAHLMEKQNDS